MSNNASNVQAGNRYRKSKYRYSEKSITHRGLGCISRQLHDKKTDDSSEDYSVDDFEGDNEDKHDINDSSSDEYKDDEGVER